MAYLAVLGVALGLALLGIAVGLGAGSIVLNNRAVYESLRWAGTLYLCWLAFDSWKEARQPIETAPVSQLSYFTYFHRGFVTNLLNPKAALFFIAVLPEFIQEPVRSARELAILVSIYVGVATFVHALIVALARVEIHEMALDKGIMTMRPLDGGLLIEAGKTAKFEPGGRHLMLIGLAAPLTEGEQISVSLAFEQAGQVSVPFAVQSIGGRAPDPLTRVEAALKPVPPVAANDPDEPFFAHFCNSKAMANITVSPGRAGPVEIAIQLEDGDERPLTTAKGVSVTLANPDKGIAPVTAIAKHVGDDKWVVRMDAPQSGRWSLDLGIRLSATDAMNIEAPILIR